MIHNEPVGEGIDLNRMAEIGRQPSHEWRIYLAAIEYSKMGWHLVPIVPNGKRLPRKETNINYGSASNNRKTIDGWFNPDHGKFAGNNVGIACGKEGGLFVIDVDRHGENDGLESFGKLTYENDQYWSCPIAKTPNDGEHYYLQWQDNAAATTGKIGPSIDTRGGDETNCKSHVVAFPSVVDGKMYKWIQGGKEQEAPKWIMEKLGVLWKPRAVTGSGRGNENLTDEDMERPISEDQVVSMLAKIDPNDCDYDAWLRIGMSIKSQLNNPRGLEIWDSWSQRGIKYDSGECIKRWDTFSDLGTVRGGTLFHWAKIAGWEPDTSKGERSGNPYDELVESMNKEYAVVVVGGKIRILREKPNAHHEWEMHYDLLHKDGFLDLLSNEVIWSNSEPPKPIPVSKVWLAHEGRRTYENGLALFPDSDTPEGYYNTWNGFSVSPREGQCNLFLDHLKGIVCGGNDEAYNWLFTWLADLVQNPSNPKGCAVIMRGGEGCGKGTFAYAIGKLFGPHHRHLIDDSHLTSNFNSHLFDAITIFADEITWGGNKKTAGKLKGIVTEKYLIGERKGVDAIQYQNRCHLMIASNSEWVIPADFDSRRWFVLDVIGDKIGDHGYFNAIDDELNNGGMEALLYKLLNYQIPDINLIRTAIVTKALTKQRVLNLQHDTAIRWWLSIVESGEFPVTDAKTGETGWPTLVSKSDLYSAYERYCMDRNKYVDMMSPWGVKVINNFGLKPARIRVGGANLGKLAVYKVPPIQGCKDKLNEKFEGIIE